MTTLTRTDSRSRKGSRWQHWLAGSGALTSGELPIVKARHNAYVGPTNTVSRPWIVADQNAEPTRRRLEYFSFNTPLGAAPVEQCGQVVFSDSTSGPPRTTRPERARESNSADRCANGDLSPQEKALEFLVFNLSVRDPDGPGAGGLPPPK